MTLPGSGAPMGPVTEAELLEYLASLEAELASPTAALPPTLPLAGRALDPSLDPARVTELLERLEIAVGTLAGRQAELAAELRRVAAQRR